MKKLLVILILVLTFQTPSWADDIRDFQIEGMSIGDSLLDYFSENEIKANLPYDDMKTEKFNNFEIYDESLFDLYETVQATFKNNDKKYIIYQLSGTIFYFDNIDNCYKKKNEIVKNLSELFQNINEEDWGTEKHEYDKSGKSTTTSSAFIFNSGDFVRIICMDWSDEITNTLSWTDNLSVEIHTKEHSDWLDTQYK